ncbi:MAG: cupin domain-containing protein [Rhodospirillales bacterium]|nr:cupin domain-containing protein [Rhodospirillales bacterium]
MSAARLRLPAFDPADAPERRGSTYPSPFRDRVAGRVKRRLGDVAGLTQFGVNLVTLPPGCESSMRHWHARQDEFVYVLEGVLSLVTDGGEQVLGAGMAAGFPAGKPDGHQLVNRSDRVATYLEVGTRTTGDEVDYSDIDMLVRLIDGVERYVRKDGTRY